MDFVSKDVLPFRFVQINFVNDETVDMSFCYNDSVQLKFVIDGLPLNYQLMPDYVTNGLVYVEDADTLTLGALDRYELWQFTEYINDAMFIHSDKLDIVVQ